MSDDHSTPILPPATLGVLGGGQLGRHVEIHHVAGEVAVEVEDAGPAVGEASPSFNLRGIQSEPVTMPEAASTLSRALGTPLTYLQIPVSEVRKNSEDFALMLEWFESTGYNADTAALQQEFGVTFTSLEAWARKRA